MRLVGACDSDREKAKATGLTAFSELLSMLKMEKPDLLDRLGGNSRVQSIVSMMSNQVRRARAMTLYIRPLPVKSNEDHRAVFDAIRKGDATAARQRHHSHRQHAREVLIELLKKHKLFHI